MISTPVSAGVPDSPYGRGTLPPAVRSRRLAGINGLDVHFLEAGFQQANRPALLLLHGFPEIAYSWRKLMLPLADAGYHVIAPDVRGYGRTIGWDSGFDADERPFSLTNLVRDAIALLFALGHRSVAAVMGHDAGSPVAAWAALIRPDIFRSVLLLSTPFPGPPDLPFDVGHAAPGHPSAPSVLSAEMDATLALLDPPRKHYVRWFATPEADQDMTHAPQGLADFMRAYYHVKGADWPGNRPHRLSAASAAELSKLPDYYVMPRAKGMAEAVAPYMPSSAEIAGCRWLSEDEIAVYVEEYGRTGFSGGLWAYRRSLSATPDPERLTHAGRTIDVPACFIAGRSDWGTWQGPGALEAMESAACSRYFGTHLVDGAGHWVQQEQPEAVVALTLRFLKDAARAD